MTTGWSLRTRLLLLVAAASLPGVAVLLYNGFQVREFDLQETQAVLQRRARVASREAESFIQDAYDFLQALARDPVLLAGDVDARNRRLAEVLSFKRGILNLGLCSPDGWITSSALPAALPMEARSRVWYGRVLAAKRFALGDFQVGRLTGKPSLNAALPVPDDAGGIRLILFAALAVDRLLDPARIEGLLPGAAHLLIDGQGTVVYRHPDPEAWIGKDVGSLPFVRAMLERGEGTTEGIGLDGLPRLAGFARIGGAGARSDAVVAVTLPREAAYATANRLLWTSLLVMAAVLLASFGAAYALGGSFLVRRFGGLAEAVGRMERGDLSARTGAGEGGGELGNLERAFDTMAVALQKRRLEIEALNLDLERRVEERTAELARATTQVEAFFEGSADLAAVADLDGYFKRLNAAWERTLGWSREELLSKPWLDFVHPEDRESTIETGGGLARGEPVLRFENRYRCKDGSYRWLSWRVPAPQPGSSTLYAIARDVTELRGARKAIEDANARLAAANAELEAFSYSVSHDLRAPLRHVAGFVELLTQHALNALDETSRRYLKTIAEAARKMGQLIDDLLSFSRTGRAELRPSRVSMAGLVADVRQELAPDLQGRRVAWEVRDLPEATGDPAMLRQVWANLLGNAVKYTRPREEARIEVGATSGGGEGVVYFIRDNGAGFDMRYVDKLFGVFQRLHGPQEFEGTGIGLANVRRIVTRHGGRVWAEGKVGAGAAFYFTLPERIG